jgi:cysteine desulfuration protein SufE
MSLYQITIDELIGNFQLFDDWEARYSYLIDLGKKLPPMADSDKTAQTKVSGCTSQVWIKRINSDPDRENESQLDFIADSDAHIVRGLIAILMVVYAGKPAKRIAEIDIEAIFNEIGLSDHLSPNRRNGFYSMVERIKALAGQGG